MNQYDAICLGITALERSEKNPLQQDAIEALEFAAKNTSLMRAALITVQHDYASSLDLVNDLLILSQLSRMEYEHKSSHIKNRLKMIHIALGDCDDTANS